MTVWPQYPAEPWIRGTEREAECLFQEGEVMPLLLADPSRIMGEREIDGMLDRIAACVNAMAGIHDPAAFASAAKRWALAATASDAAAEADHRLGDTERARAGEDLMLAVRGPDDMTTAEAAARLRRLLQEEAST